MMDSSVLVKRRRHEIDLSKSIIWRQLKKEGLKYLVVNSQRSAEIDTSTKLKNGWLDGLTAEQK